MRVILQLEQRKGKRKKNKFLKSFAIRTRHISFSDCAKHDKVNGQTILEGDMTYVKT